MSDYTVRDMERVIALYEPPHPMTIDQVEDLTGVSRTTAYRWLRSAGKLRTREEAQQLRREREARARRWRVESAVRAYMQPGATYATVAEALDISEASAGILLRSDYAKALIRRRTNQHDTNHFYQRR